MAPKAHSEIERKRHSRCKLLWAVIFVTPHPARGLIQNFAFVFIL